MGPASAISSSGLSVAAAGVAAAASNIANATTPGYQPVRVAPEALPDGGVASRVVQAGDPLAEVRSDRALLAGQGVDLTQELLGQQVAARAYQANLAALETSQETEEALLKLIP